MIARPHVCLRCQLRLARRSTPSKTHITFQSTVSTQRSRSRILPDVDRRARKAQDDIDPSDESFHASIKRPLKLSRHPLGAPKQLSEHPLGKLYGYTGQQLRENREKLSVNVLGEEAEVIVLRDSRVNNYAYTKEEDVETQEGIDILAKLDEERGLVGWNEVETNINEFRPKEEARPQTRLEFSQLLTGLQSGFTVAQLARYLQTHVQKGAIVPQLNPDSLILRISPWTPGISGSYIFLDQGRIAGYDLQSYTSKQRLVLRILRECWKLELPFVEEGIGQVEIELKPGDLDLLLRGKSSALTRIHSNHIRERDERLESFKSRDSKRSRNAIRITTTRLKSYVIIQDIDQLLRGIHRIQFSLKDLMPQVKEWKDNNFRNWADTHFDDSMIEELGRLTNTDVKKDARGSVSISCVDPESKISNRADVARRLLVASGIFSNRVTNWVGCKKDGKAEKGVFVKFSTNEGLPWHCRLREWTRWITPVSKVDEGYKAAFQSTETEMAKSSAASTSKVGNQARSEDSGQLPSPGSESQAAEHPKIAKDHPSYVGWSDEFWTESSALLGNVLHSQPGAISSQMKGSPTKSHLSNVIHYFSTSVPNISQVLAGAPGANLEPTESVVMRFQPNPFYIPAGSKNPIGSQALSAFPPIEMRFSVKPNTKNLELKDVRAIISTENADLMLPDSPVDLRFEQKTTVRLQHLQDSRLQGLIEFLSKSHLNLDFSKGGRLDTPPMLTLPIASHLCNKDAFELLHDKDAMVKDVDYLFTGLEIRKTIAMDFDGWRLVYTSIEAGKAGGRRAELRLCPVRRTASKDSSDDSEQAFIDSAFKLADTQYTPIEVRKIMLDNIRMVPSTGQRPVGRIFKYFASRPKIQIEMEQHLKAEEELELSTEEANYEEDKKEHEDDRDA